MTTDLDQLQFIMKEFKKTETIEYNRMLLLLLFTVDRFEFSVCVFSCELITDFSGLDKKKI